jgi:hypothetical protein
MALLKEVSQWFQVGLKFFESDRTIAKIDSTVKPSDPVFFGVVKWKKRCLIRTKKINQYLTK